MSKAVSGHSAPKSGMAVAIAAIPLRRPWLHSRVDNKYESSRLKPR